MQPANDNSDMNDPVQLEVDFVAEIKARIAESDRAAQGVWNLTEEWLNARAKAGVLLIEARARLPKSKSWIEWLAENFSGPGQSVRTMQRVEAIGRDYLHFESSEAKASMSFLEWRRRMRKLEDDCKQMELLPETTRPPGSQVARDHSERWILSTGKALADVKDMLAKHPIETWTTAMRITVKARLQPVRDELSAILEKL